MVLHCTCTCLGLGASGRVMDFLGGALIDRLEFWCLWGLDVFPGSDYKSVSCRVSFYGKVL